MFNTTALLVDSKCWQISLLIAFILDRIKLAKRKPSNYQWLWVGLMVTPLIRQPKLRFMLQLHRLLLSLFHRP
jgi:hypothetical protein